MSMTEENLRQYTRTAKDFDEAGMTGTAGDYRDFIKEIRYLQRQYEMLRTETITLRAIIRAIKELVA